MRDDRKTELKVGITVFFGILLTLWILGWAKNASFFSDPKPLVIRFDSVAGLTVGDGVYINGVKKGIVKEIKLDGNSILVNINFDEQIELKKDATFSIMMLDLMGGKKIEISSGKSDEKMDYNLVQSGKFAGDVSTAMAALGSVQDELIAIIKDVRVSLNNVNDILTDQELKSDIKTTITSTKNLISKVTLLVDENKTEINDLLKNGNSLLLKTDNFIESNEPEIKRTLSNLNTLLKNSDSLVVKLNYLSQETKDKKNNLGKILYDEETYNKLTLTIQKLNEMIDELNTQLKGKGINVDLF